MTDREIVIEGFLFSTDKAKLDVTYVHQFLSQKSYWAQGIPLDFVARSIANSLSIGIYDIKEGMSQVGFARVITDFTTFAYLGDVFVDEGCRGRGISKNLMNFIFEMDEMKLLRRFILATRDAHSLYSRFGFSALKAPDRFMEIAQPDIYKQMSKD